MNTHVKTQGSLHLFADLDPSEQLLINGAWKASHNAYIPRSHFPVGSVIVAENDRGEFREFSGCNVENRFFPATICAERTAALSAVAAGYRKFHKVALAMPKHQGAGASPCGVCRQVLMEFGPNATVLDLADAEKNVNRFLVCELLPAAASKPVSFDNLEKASKKIVKRLESISVRSYVPYSKRPGASIFTASSEKGRKRSFAGVPDDNSSYGASALSESVAMRTARTAGYYLDVTLAVMVENPTAGNPLEGEVLQILREFGVNSRVMLVGPDRSVVNTTVAELLPDSFGPEVLG